MRKADKYVGMLLKFYLTISKYYHTGIYKIV